MNERKRTRKNGRLNKPRRTVTPWWDDKDNPNHVFVEARNEKLAMMR